MPSKREKTEDIDTVYVIGAGASIPYGMPSGAELKTNILNLLKNDNQRNRLHKMQFNTPELDALLHGFELSPTPSIDAFLAARPNLKHLGKTLISMCLLEKERTCHIDKRNIDGDWLSYLFNNLDLNRFPENLSKIKFVTFNYDRLIERFFDMAFQHTFGSTPTNIPHVIRVHGSLGDYRRNDYEDLREYQELPLTFIKNSADSIRIVHEEGSSCDAKDVIEKARRVVVLGLSYATENIEKIWPDVKAKNPNSGTFWGSTYGMEEAEKERIKLMPRYVPDYYKNQSQPNYGRIDEDCLKMLKKYNTIPIR